ncbi:exonuclease sbcCD subunit D [bacterium F16]|nr:exonuclease sbcCD subunit D [bacterium F16]
MKVIHTSDWHIGRSLYGRKRYDEFEQFLDWMVEAIQDVRADVLLIAGDIFDTTSPSNKAQQLYYKFLCNVSNSCCRHIVVTAGNHDSPSFISAPQELLHCLNVHVIGAAPADPADCVLELKDEHGDTELLVCAVPYLRDRDVRPVEAGESIDDKRLKLLSGIREYYAAAVKRAVDIQSGQPGVVPIIGMGHLFTSGGKTVDGDGVRELYVGSLAHVEASSFPDAIDYLAMGHLHVPQVIGGSPCKRYSGSPIPMGFGEAGQAKSVVLITFDTRTPVVELIPVDTFLELRTLSGDWPALAEALTACKAEGRPLWIEAEYTGDEIVTDLRERMTEHVDGAPIEILRIKNNRILNRVLAQTNTDESLEDLDPKHVFERRLDSDNIAENDRKELVTLYNLAVQSLHDTDEQAE